MNKWLKTEDGRTNTETDDRTGQVDESIDGWKEERTEGRKDR